MTERKWTKGPWTVPHFAQPDINCECNYILCDTKLGAICSVFCSGDGDDWQNHGDNPRFAEAVANARLIAAAPELLEALTAASEYLDYHNIPVEIVAMVDFAIAKALGETNV